jgi:hypothetical protein
MEFSQAGLIGAVGGAAIGFFSARFIVAVLEHRLRALDRSQTSEERSTFERKLVLMRRMILSAEVGGLAVAGYFAGSLLWG